MFLSLFSFIRTLAAALSSLHQGTTPRLSKASPSLQERCNTIGSLSYLQSGGQPSCSGPVCNHIAAIKQNTKPFLLWCFCFPSNFHPAVSQKKCQECKKAKKTDGCGIRTHASCEMRNPFEGSRYSLESHVLDHSTNPPWRL